VIRTQQAIKESIKFFEGKRSDLYKRVKDPLNYSTIQMLDLSIEIRVLDKQIEALKWTLYE
jgi:hypothetical protein